MTRFSFAIMAATLAAATSARADTFTVCAPQGVQVTLITEMVTPAPTPDPKKTARKAQKPCASLERLATACKATAPAVDCTAITASLTSCHAEAQKCATDCASCWDAWLKRWGTSPVATAASGAPAASAASALPAAAIVPPPALTGGRPASGVTRALDITTAPGGR